MQLILLSLPIHHGVISKFPSPDTISRLQHNIVLVAGNMEGIFNVAGKDLVIQDGKEHR